MLHYQIIKLHNPHWENTHNNSIVTSVYRIHNWTQSTRNISWLFPPEVLVIKDMVLNNDHRGMLIGVTIECCSHMHRVIWYTTSSNDWRWFECTTAIMHLCLRAMSIWNLALVSVHTLCTLIMHSCLEVGNKISLHFPA